MEPDPPEQSVPKEYNDFVQQAMGVSIYFRRLRLPEKTPKDTQ